jgi:valyl-tRNA synthetase
MSRILDNPNWLRETREANRLVVAHENASQVARDAEMNRARAIEQEKKDLVLQQRAEQHRLERKKEIEAEEKRIREEVAKNLGAALRESFFRANPNALESDFERVKDRLKDEHFLEKMKAERTTKEMFAKTSIRM